MQNIELVVKFGDSETIIYQKDKGIVCKEPSKIAFSKRGKKLFVEDIGQRAKEMIGKTDGSVYIQNPFANGCVDNIDLAVLFFNQLLEKYVHYAKSKLNIVFLINCALEAEERRIFEILAISCGIRKCSFVPCVFVDALGSDLNIDKLQGKMVVDIGAECTELVLISDCNIVCGYSLEIGGSVIDKEIENFLFREYNIVVTENVAEKIKISLASLYASDISSLNFTGYDALTKSSRKASLLAKDLYPIFSVFYDKIAEGIMIFLNQISPDFVNDVTKNGLLIAGGNAKITGLESYMKNKTGVNVFTCSDSSVSFANGCKKLLQDKLLLKKIVNKN